ncbi:MAG: CoA ester lyase [Lachnospiraceae bacterium]|nr:CoA ester lyase [Lachnospiraceae bacterium]
MSRITDILCGESWLFVPAREKMMRSKGKDAADVVIYDLEDALGPDEKDTGLALLVQALSRSAEASELSEAARHPRVYIRINGGTDRVEKELTTLKNCEFEGYVLPKTEDLSLADRYPDLFENRRIAALVETPRGILNLDQIAGDSRVHALMLGGEDFCASLGVPSSPEALAYARSQIILFAAAYGKKSLDTVSFEYRDQELFLTQFEASLKLGFSGKLMIHPAQARAAADREAGLLDSEALRRAAEIVRLYHEAGGGALVLDGKVYEAMHIARLERLCRRRS